MIFCVKIIHMKENSQIIDTIKKSYAFRSKFTISKYLTVSEFPLGLLLRI